jgi:hypothetical protein
MRFSQTIPKFHETLVDGHGWLVGYAAIRQALELPCPLIAKRAVIHEKHKQYETDTHRVFTPRHAPQHTLEGHLLFALKYEGLNLLILGALCTQMEAEQWTERINDQPQSKYWRRIWFLYEQLTKVQLSVPDLTQGAYVLLLDPNVQYATERFSLEKRYRIKNNLPGVLGFCPLIHRLKEIDAFLNTSVDGFLLKQSSASHLLRAISFVSLGDSRSSFEIEGERTNRNHELLWANTIADSAQQTLSISLLENLQKTVLSTNTKLALGLRTKDGFVGIHDRNTASPQPEHISARWQDVEPLLAALLSMRQRQADFGYHPVLSAASLAFGFVFVHPFADGNGRVHRYLIQHVLLKSAWPQPGFILPISEAILAMMHEYASVLRSWSHAMLPYIKWEETSDHNVQVTNQTDQLYRYFDATNLLCKSYYQMK